MVTRGLGSQNIKATLWLASGYLIKQGTQFLSFILLARLIGSYGLGAFNSVLAFAALVSPFVEMGGYNLVVKDISHGLPPNKAIGNSLTLSLMLFPIVLILALLLKNMLFCGLDCKFVFCIVVAEILSNRITSLVAGANVAQGLGKRNGIVESSMGITRLILVCILYHLHGNLDMWAYLYASQSILFSSIVLYWSHKTWGKIELVDIKSLRERFSDGLHFAFANSSQTASLELDKVLLGGLSGYSQVGIFSAAQRIVTIPNVFIFSLLTSVYPNFFRLGSISHRKSKDYGLNLLKYTVPFSVISCITLFILSEFIVRLLGESFYGAQEAMKVLSVLILLNGIHYPLADALTGANKQVVRTGLYIFTLIMNLGLNFILIPKYGWRGAAISTLLSQGCLVIFLASYTYISGKEE